MINYISGAVLAGGSSNRFKGINKAKIAVGGKTMISMILDTMNDVFDEVMIVTNNPEEYKEYITTRIIKDEYLNKGPLAGIHAAIKYSCKEAVFVVACDMPLIEKESLIRQIQLSKDKFYDVLIPGAGELIEPLHGIYRNTILASLEKYLESSEDNSIKTFLRQVNVRYLNTGQLCGSETLFTNINYPSDLMVLKK